MFNYPIYKHYFNEILKVNEIELVENNKKALFLQEDEKMAKRKAQFDAVKKYSKTPKKNLQESEFSAEFTHGENPMKGANRNSKQGRKGRS